MARNIKANRIVVKIGTNTLADRKGLVDIKLMQDLVAQIAKIKNSKDIVIITSGAIGAGMKELGLKEKPKDVINKQVCAAIGQNILMNGYYSFFKKHRIKIAQVLLTYRDFADKETLSNLQNSLHRLFELGVIPIINENDPISINEIGPSFGDNDNLSAMIAKEINADLLILLTNVEGLFDRNPKDKNAVLVKEVKSINKKIACMASGSSNLGVGGMKSKVEAAKEATKAGATVVVANGKTSNVLLKILRNEDIGTIFYPKK